MAAGLSQKTWLKLSFRKGGRIDAASGSVDKCTARSERLAAAVMIIPKKWALGRFYKFVSHRQYYIKREKKKESKDMSKMEKSGFCMTGKPTFPSHQIPPCPDKRFRCRIVWNKGMGGTPASSSYNIVFGLENKLTFF